MVNEVSTQSDDLEQKEQTDGSDPSGIVYVLTNSAMPGMVKIGKTKRDDVSQRVRELWTTEVPLPFKCVRAVRVPDVVKAERSLHRAFDPNRRHPRREFFGIEPEQAIALLDLIKLADVTPEYQDSIGPLDTEEIDPPGDARI